ncbi:PREDICTED: putative non-specific lipid-transfer protein 14 [Nelumbo nucifera]|uniref:Non-specific lipid-transfer protein n=2 Tax=Nelumbo nucifera TaxID=4432 RepID=A0A822ZWS7_NELNU|nr:PREDICTED: putative non-specific lipid-transfer protein 14 [Nelumbo nucifera]DAD47991.1 TPA_asm: hypothetical protein HUJ06_017928 [Nelumbo nucifera]
MESCNRKACKAWLMGTLILFSSCATLVAGTIDCGIVTTLVSTCTNFITYGSPDPFPGSPCCDSILALDHMADSSTNNRQSVCRCLMSLISPYNPNSTAIATLPGLCGISLGFTIDPNTNCN